MEAKPSYNAHLLLAVQGLLNRLCIMASAPYLPTSDHILATRRKPDWYATLAPPNFLSSSSVGLNLDGQKPTPEDWALPRPEHSKSNTSNCCDACVARKRRDSRISIPDKILIDVEQSSTGSGCDFEDGIIEGFVGARLPYPASTLRASAPIFRPVACQSQSDWHREWYQRHLCTGGDDQLSQGYSSTGIFSRSSSPAYMDETRHIQGNRSVSRGRDGYRHVRDRVATPWTMGRRREPASG